MSLVFWHLTLLVYPRTCPFPSRILFDGLSNTAAFEESDPCCPLRMQRALQALLTDAPRLVRVEDAHLIRSAATF